MEDEEDEVLVRIEERVLEVVGVLVETEEVLVEGTETDDVVVVEVVVDFEVTSTTPAAAMTIITTTMMATTALETARVSTIFIINYASAKSA